MPTRAAAPREILIRRLPIASAESDSALLHRYVAGDPRGAEALFARHREALLGFLLRRLRDRDAAEESVQEIFLRLLEQARSLADHPRLDAWLFAVARNVSADVLRRRRAAAAPFTAVQGVGMEAALPDSAGTGPEKRLQSHELNRLILEVLRELPAAEKEVFLLRTQSMLSFREIAARLGAPLNTVLSRMHRALMRIRKAMWRAGWIRRAPRPGGAEAGSHVPFSRRADYEGCS